MATEGLYSLKIKERKTTSGNEAELLQLALPIFAELPDLKLAIAYGSIASGFMRPDSDVDIAVLFSQAMTAEKNAACRAIRPGN